MHACMRHTDTHGMCMHAKRSACGRCGATMCACTPLLLHPHLAPALAKAGACQHIMSFPHPLSRACRTSSHSACACRGFMGTTTHHASTPGSLSGALPTPPDRPCAATACGGPSTTQLAALPSNAFPITARRGACAALRALVQVLDRRGGVHQPQDPLRPLPARHHRHLCAHHDQRHTARRAQRLRPL